MKRLSFAITTSLLAFALACGSPPPGQGRSEVESSPQANVSFKIEKVIGGLQVPWSIVWAPDGRMIFTERPGHVRVFENGALRKNALYEVKDVEPTGESGLMGLALHPQFSSNHFLYLSYAYAGDGGVPRRVYRDAECGSAPR